MSPKHCVSRTHLFNVLLCRGMEWDAAPGYTGDAVVWKPALSRVCCWVLSQNVAGRSPWLSDIPGMSPGDVPGESRDVTPECPAVWRWEPRAVGE